MGDFFNGLDDPTTVSLDSVDGGMYDYGSFTDVIAPDTSFEMGGSMPDPIGTPPVIAPDMSTDTVPSFLKTDPTIPSSGGSIYWGTADESAAASDTWLSDDPLAIPPSAARSMAQGSGQTGAMWSAVGAGAVAGAKVLSQGQTSIPSNPRGAQTVGLGFPQPLPSQSLQPLGMNHSGPLGALQQSGTGVLLLIAAGLVLIWLAKR